MRTLCKKALALCLVAALALTCFVGTLSVSAAETYNATITVADVELSTPAETATAVLNISIPEGKAGINEAIFDISSTIGSATDVKLTNSVVDAGTADVDPTQIDDENINYNRFTLSAYQDEDATELNGITSATIEVTFAVAETAVAGKYPITIDVSGVRAADKDEVVINFVYDNKNPAKFIIKCDDGAHTYGNTVVGTPATCGAAGAGTQECSVCGDVKEVVIDATGEHSYTYAPAEAGKHSVDCLNCDTVFDAETCVDENQDKSCDKCNADLTEDEPEEPEVDKDIQIKATLYIQAKYGCRFNIPVTPLAKYDHYDLVITNESYDDDYNITTTPYTFKSTEWDDFGSNHDFYYFAETAAYALDLNMNAMIYAYDENDVCVAKSNPYTFVLSDMLKAKLTTTASETNTLYIDLLNLGAAAQEFFKPGTDSALDNASAINAGIEAYAHLGTQEVPTVDAEVDKFIKDSTHEIGGTLLMSASNDIRFSIKVPNADQVEGLKVRVTFTEYNGTKHDNVYDVSSMQRHSATYRLKVYDQVPLYSASDVVTAVLYHEDDPDTILAGTNYSIDCFIAANVSKTAYKDLLEPLAKFTASLAKIF